LASELSIFSGVKTSFSVLATSHVFGVRIGRHGQFGQHIAQLPANGEPSENERRQNHRQKRDPHGRRSRI
jgi:hypothetical protein